MQQLAAAQMYMSRPDVALDGWLIYDFRGSNALLTRLLPPEAGAKRWTTRRVALYIPRTGTPHLLVHEIDSGQFPPERYPAVRVSRFLSWPQWHAWLKETLPPGGRVAMEYSPGAALPVNGVVDAGTVELVRSCGADVVSSADLAQATVAAWSPEAVAEHRRASELVNGIKDRAFAAIAKAHREGRAIAEHEVADLVRAEFASAGLQSPDGPVVAVNGHAADPHYEPLASRPQPIRPGDWVLLDLWARVPGEQHIFSDITWVACCSPRPKARHAEVFAVVAAARDAALHLAQQRWRERRPVRGWELDDAARSVIERAGLGHGLRHRTGHSLSPGPLVHGLGMNLDNLETRDTRLMLPGTGFTIEPGVYLPEEHFGIRSEINVFVDPQAGPMVTSQTQSEPVVLG